MKVSKLILQIDQILDQANDLIASELLSRAYTLAKLANDQQLEKWLLLETSGYFDTNPALTDDIYVPNYRKVPGYYQDKVGRPLLIEDPDLAKILNHYHIREGAAELEAIAGKNGMTSLRNAFVNSQIRQSLGVEVDEFHFKNFSVKSILHEIRNQVISRLIELRKTLSENAVAVGISPDTPKELINLHPTVQKTAGELYKNGHYRQAILDTYIALVNAVKIKSLRHDLDNTPLMQATFSPKNPLVKVSAEQDEQQGFMWLFSGAVMGIRNPKAHRLIEQNDPQRTLEWLSFASVLLRVLDEAEVVKE